MALYRSNINIGAALCFPWWWGRGRCGSPRIDRISRCISLRSWLFSRRWIKLEWNSLSKLKFVKAVLARTQQLHTTSRTGARRSKSGAMVRVVRNCALFCSPRLLEVETELEAARIQYPKSRTVPHVEGSSPKSDINSICMSFNCADFSVHPQPASN